MKSIAYKKFSRHGGDGSPEYQTWIDMRRRCNDPRRENYTDYGGRGITVCARWKYYQNFIADMGKRPDPSYSLERLNNNKGYSPQNCRWATRVEQQNNKRNNNLITSNGITKSLAQWAKTLGLAESTIRNRINRGWNNDQILWVGDGRHKPRIDV